MRIYLDESDNLRIEHDNSAERMELRCLAQEYKDDGFMVERVKMDQNLREVKGA